MSKQLFYIEFMTVTENRDGTVYEFVHKQLVSAQNLKHAVCLIEEVYNVAREEILIARLASAGDFDGDNIKRVMGFDAKYAMRGWWSHVGI